MDKARQVTYCHLVFILCVAEQGNKIEIYALLIFPACLFLARDYCRLREKGMMEGEEWLKNGKYIGVGGL